MKLHELIVLQEILKREEEFTKGHILITREKLQTLQTLKNERDNSDLSSDRMLDHYEDRLKRRNTIKMNQLNVVFGNLVALKKATYWSEAERILLENQHLTIEEAEKIGNCPVHDGVAYQG